jgi:hypothetical protein
LSGRALGVVDGPVICSISRFVIGWNFGLHVMIDECCHATAGFKILGIEFEDFRQEDVPHLIVDPRVSWLLKEATCFLLQLGVDISACI